MPEAEDSLPAFPIVSEIKGVGVTSGESQITHLSQDQNCFLKLCGNLGAFKMEPFPACHFPQAQSLRLGEVTAPWASLGCPVILQRPSPRGATLALGAWYPGAQVVFFEPMDELMTSNSKLFGSLVRTKIVLPHCRSF